MHIGPSMTINLVGKLNIHGYFRFDPSFSVLHFMEYAIFFVGGASVSYGTIGWGIESRSGNSKYKEFSSDGDGKIQLMIKPNKWI